MDYRRYKTETLEKMRDRAWEKYKKETEKSCGNWGDGMRLAKLPQCKAWDKAREKYYGIVEELARRKNEEKKI